MKQSFTSGLLRSMAGLLIGLYFLVAGLQSVQAGDQPPQKLKVLVVVGGHPFPDSFFKMLDENQQISYTVAKQTTHAEAWDRDDLLNYDVILLYDFQRELNDAQKAKFLSLFDKGVGLFVLHHALLSYQTWPEYERIVGGKYLLDHETVNGVDWPASTYNKEMVDIDVKVTDKTHPVTAGLDDFVVHDEIYRGVRHPADINILMTTEGNPLAWTRQEKKSRVVGTIVGHGPAHSDANFRKFLAQGLVWAANKQ